VAHRGLPTWAVFVSFFLPPFFCMAAPAPAPAPDPAPAPPFTLARSLARPAFFCDSRMQFFLLCTRTWAFNSATVGILINCTPLYVFVLTPSIKI
jgi:hypothetical protein